MKEVLYKSRFLILCAIFSLMGIIHTSITNNLIFFIYFFILFTYSGVTVANRMDDYEEEQRNKKL